jgi:hypothetical protein
MATLDPTKPADHAPIVSAELRNQFQAIQERYDNLLLVQPLGLQVGDPPTQAEVQAIADKLDELINRVQGG